MINQHERDLHYLRMAARLALRGHGGAEPNPMVGCVIVSPRDEVIGWGYHRRCGEAHAEINALRRAGDRAAGSTVYVTLEPCNHTGRTGPCGEALIDARVARVVAAARDPNPAAAGGIKALRAAGIEAVVVSDCDDANRLNEPFVYRVTTGLPWIVAKWAQTIDGRIATRTGDSRWISSERSRRMVHRKRGRVDAILTGIGTVLADDPQLTARVRNRRRIARRVVIDPRLETPINAMAVQNTSETPTTIVCSGDAIRSNAAADALKSAGADVIGFDTRHGEINLRDVVRTLAEHHAASTVLVEGGSRLLGRLFAAQLVNEAWVFLAPRLMADPQALAAVTGEPVMTIADARQFRLIDARRRGDDVVLRYRSNSM